MKARFQFLFLLVLLSLLAGCSPTPSPANTPPPTEVPPLPTAVPPQFVSAITGTSNPLLFPTTVAVDAQGNLYVADVGHAQVQVFGPNGDFLTAWGAPGRGDGQFFVSDHCCFLGVDGESNVYVMDSSSRIQKFNSKGNFLAQWGSPGTRDGQFSDWATIAVSQDGTVYAGDVNQGGIQKFDRTGKFLLRWGEENNGSPALFYPITVVLDEAGNVYARDGTEGKILKFDPDGSLLSEISLPEIDGKVPLAGGFVVNYLWERVRLGFVQPSPGGVGFIRLRA